MFVASPDVAQANHIDPTTLGTLNVWLDASDGATVQNTSALPAGNGDPLGTWFDKAGAANDASPAVGNPTYDTSGGPLSQPVIDFTGANSNLVTSGGTTARTIAMVHRWDTTASGTPAYLMDLRNGVANSFV